MASAERTMTEGVVLGSYRFTKYLTGDRVPKAHLERVTLVLHGVHGKITKDAKAAMDLGQQVAEAITIARDLINEPPNELTPEVLANRAVEVCKENGLEVSVLDKAGLTKKGMKLFLAVAGGSVHEPRMVHMT